MTVIQTRHPSSTMGTFAPGYSRNAFSSLPGGTTTAVTTRQVSLRDLVVTPGRVPKFTIPSLRPPRRLRAQNYYKRDKSALGSPDGSRRYTIAWLPRSPPSHRTCHPGPESEFIFWGEFACEDLSDPVSRAAMSLPHLPKITTPYGFLTLGESPSVRRRESLFFEGEIPRICITGTRDGNLLLPYTLTSTIPRTQSYPISNLGNLPRTARRTLRSLSCDAATSLSRDSHQSETRADSLQMKQDSRLSSPLAPASSGRGRLQRLLKKRLAAVRTLKPSQCWVKRCSIDNQSKQKASVTPETNTTID